MQPVPHRMPDFDGSRCGQPSVSDTHDDELQTEHTLMEKSAQLGFLSEHMASGAAYVAQRRRELMAHRIAAETEEELGAEWAYVVCKHEGHLAHHEQEACNSEKRCSELRDALNLQTDEVNERVARLLLAQSNARCSQEAALNGKSRQQAALFRTETEDLERQRLKQETLIAELRLRAEAEAMAF